jgi:hypothetical protein
MSRRRKPIIGKVAARQSDATVSATGAVKSPPTTVPATDTWALDSTEEPAAVFRATDYTERLDEAIRVVTQAGRADLVPGLQRVRAELQRLIEADRKRHQKRRFTDTLLIEAALRIEAGETESAVAADMGISRKTLYNYRLKKS